MSEAVPLKLRWGHKSLAALQAGVPAWLVAFTDAAAAGVTTNAATAARVATQNSSSRHRRR